MKKTTIALSVLLAGAGGLYAYAHASGLPDSKLQESASVLNVAADHLRLPQAEINRLKNIESYGDGIRSSSVKKAEGKDGEIVDLWGTAPVLGSYSYGATLDREANTYTFDGYEDADYVIVGVDENNYYCWYSELNYEYRFSGLLTATGAATVFPCIVYRDDNGQFIAIAYKEVALNGENGFASSFEVTVNEMDAGYPVMIGYIVKDVAESVSITSSENSFVCYYHPEIEWMTIDVPKPGEFAQTYLEGNDYDWSSGRNIKVTGTLSPADLKNFKELLNLRRLDLSEAEFTALPQEWLSSSVYLNTVKLPSGVTELPAGAFSYCQRLSTVEAPGVIHVENYAFSGCYRLTDFDLSKVNYIGREAFYNCVSYNPVKLSDNLSVLLSGAFQFSGITEAILPEGLTQLNSNLFYDCEQLRKVVVPSTVSMIDYGAFSNCVLLSDLTLNNGLTGIEDEAFTGCTALREIDLPETLLWIDSYAFSRCTGLESVICRSVTPPVAQYNFTYAIEMANCPLYVPSVSLDSYRNDSQWSVFQIMKPLDQSISFIEITRPVTLNLMAENDALFSDISRVRLMGLFSYDVAQYVGQLTTVGDGVLHTPSWEQTGTFTCRDYSYYHFRPSYINEGADVSAETMANAFRFEKDRWHFISFPYNVKLSDIRGLYNTDFVIRGYNSGRRASGYELNDNWDLLSSSDVLEAGKGYIIQTANNNYDENGNSYKAWVEFLSSDQESIANYFHSGDVTVPLEEHISEFPHNSSWNLVGNPYPCYYDMSQLGEDFHSPVTFWRGSSYQAYSPIDDELVLQPNEAFFVQRSEGSESILFRKEGRMHYDQAHLEFSNPGIFVASEKGTADLSRSVFNFNIEGCGSDDRARIVMNEKASMGYESDRDASKFFAEANGGVELFVNDGVRYDICERPFGDGSAKLGLKAATSGTYTLSLSGRNSEGWRVFIHDTKAKVTTCLSDMPYSFEASGTDSERFIVTFEAPDYSGVEDLNAPSFEEDVEVISLSGEKVFEGKLDAFRGEAVAGVYIVVGKERTAKIIVK